MKHSVYHFIHSIDLCNFQKIVSCVNRSTGKVYESELVSILQTSKITLHALEIRESIITPKLHLKKLSTASGGQYVAIEPTMSVAGQVATFVSKIIDQLEGGKPVEQKGKPVSKTFHIYSSHSVVVSPCNV